VGRGEEGKRKKGRETKTSRERKEGGRGVVKIKSEGVLQDIVQLNQVIISLLCSY